jgi:capsular exopolysaccharide synthesis family protein
MPPASLEQFRKLGATLHEMQRLRGTRVVMITSAVAGEGKSFTAANIAITLSASYGRQVLLVDADLRRPALHELFGAPVDEGLTTGLASADRQIPIWRMSPTLGLIPAGPPEPDPMKALTSPRMRALVEEACSTFDWIIIDTPPLDALADAALLVSLADGVILVTAAGTTPCQVVQSAVDGIGRTCLLGVVLNRVPLSALGPCHYASRRTAAAR